MKGTKKILALLLCLAMAGTLLSGCGGGGSEDSADGTGSRGGSKSLVIGTGQSCGTLDPLQSYDGWYAVRFGFGQTLTKLNDDFSVSGWLVERGWRKAPLYHPHHRAEPGCGNCPQPDASAACQGTGAPLADGYHRCSADASRQAAGTGGKSCGLTCWKYCGTIAAC